MEIIYLEISFLGRAGMAAYFGGKVCPWKVQKTIHLSFLTCAIVCSSRLVFVLLFDCVLLLACRDPGGRRGNMEQILDQLRCPVASIEALSTTRWSMRLLLYQRIALAIKMASK